MLGRACIAVVAGLALCLTTPAALEVSVQAQAVERPSVDEVRAVIADVAQRYGLPVERMERIARCESHFDALARSRDGAEGVFQFVPSTFAWASAGAGFAGSSPYDYVANVEAAGWLMAQGGWSHWTCK